MASVNKVIIVGRLGQDPDIRVFQNGDKIANLSIATSERWTDKTTGEQKEQTEWHRVVLLGKVAGVAEQYLKKGSQVYIEGSLHTRKYTGQDGIERYTTEIKSYAIQMLGSPQNSGQQGGQSSYNDGYAPQGQAYAPQQTSQGYQPPQQPTQGKRYATTPDGQPIAPPPTDVPNDDMPF